MRALRLAFGVAMAVSLLLLGGDLWLRAIPDGPTIVREAAVHPPRISVVIAKPTPKRNHPITPVRKPRASHAPAELAAAPAPARSSRATHPHPDAPKPVAPAPKPVVKPAPAAPAPQSPTPNPTPSPTPTPTPTPAPPTPPSPPGVPPIDTPPPPPEPTPEPPPGPPTSTPTEPPPPSTPAALSTGHCANYASQALDGTSVTVFFGVNAENCPVTLTSYQSTPTGHTHELYAAGVFAIGSWSLTVALTCGTDNQVDLFLGPPPLILGGPSASIDLGAWAIIPACPS